MIAARASKGFRGPRALWPIASLTAIALVTLAVRARGHHAPSPPPLDDHGDRAAVSGTTRGALLQYLPEQCAAYRVYVDVAAVASTLHLTDVLTSEHVPGPWKSIFGTFESAHLRLGREIRELAVCAQEVARDDDETAKVYVAVGGQMGGRDALRTYRTIVQELTHAKDAEVLEKESAGVPYLVSSYTPGRKWIAMPAPDVLVFFTDSTAEVAGLAKPHEVDRAQWSLRGSVLASFAWSAESDDDTQAGDPTAGSVFVGPSAAGGDGILVLDAKGSVRTSGALDPALLASVPGKLADAFAASPFGPLADPVRRMTLQRIRSTAVHLRLEVPVPALIEAGHIASRDPHAVRELLDNLRHVASPKR